MIEHSNISLKNFKIMDLQNYGNCVHCKTKTDKNFADLIKKISWILKIFKYRILLRGKFLKIQLSINLPWGLTKSLRTIGSAVFIDVYWMQTNRQTDKQSIYIELR